MTKDANYERLYNSIAEYMKNRSGSNPALLINHSFITYTNRNLGINRKIIYCRYNLDPKVTRKLEFGVIDASSKFNKFQKESAIEEFVINKLLETTIHGVDLGLSTDLINLGFTHNSSLKLLDIFQLNYDKLFTKIYVEDDKMSGTMGSKERNILYKAFETSSFISYSNLLKQKVLKYLRRNSKSNSMIKFYYTFDVYRVLFVKGPCVFNPLLEPERNKKLLEESELFKASKNKVVELKQLFIYHLDDKKICESLNFNGYTKLTYGFISMVILGILNDSFPNNRNHIYQSNFSGDIISVEKYISLDPESKSEYSERNTLLGLCSSYYRRLGHSNEISLYEIVKTAKLF